MSSIIVESDPTCKLRGPRVFISNHGVEELQVKKEIGFKFDSDRVIPFNTYDFQVVKFSSRGVHVKAFMTKDWFDQNKEFIKYIIKKG